MKRRRHTPEQIIRKLIEGEKLLGQGQSIDDVARHLEITESTWHRWRAQYGGMKADDAKRLKELEKENTRLKKIVADQALDIDMLKELSRGKLLTPDCRRRAVRSLASSSGSPSAGPVGWSGSPGPPSASLPPPPLTTSSPCGRGFVTSPAVGPAGAEEGRRRGEEGGLAGEPPADPPPVADRRPEGALQEAREAAPGHRPAGGGDVPHPAQRGVGHGLPVR